MMDDVPLRDAVRNLARQLALEISFDSELSANDGFFRSKFHFVGKISGQGKRSPRCSTILI
jgi:hypothetical protein